MSLATSGASVWLAAVKSSFILDLILTYELFCQGVRTQADSHALTCIFLSSRVRERGREKGSQRKKERERRI